MLYEKKFNERRPKWMLLPATQLHMFCTVYMAQVFLGLLITTCGYHYTGRERSITIFF